MEYTVYINRRGGDLPAVSQAFNNVADARTFAGDMRKALTIDGERFVVETPLKQFKATKFNTLYGGGAWVYGYWPETNEEIVISGWK